MHQTAFIHPFRRSFPPNALHHLAQALLLYAMLGLPPLQSCAQEPGYYHLPIQPNMVTQLSGGISCAQNLFDGDSSTFWFTGWDQAGAPSFALVDLGASFPIRKIRVFDGSGRPFLHISGATEHNGTYVQFVSTELYEYNQWRDYPVQEYVRYIHIELQNPQGEQPIGEMEIYLHDGTEVEPPPVQGPFPPAKTGEAAKIAVNGFHWVPLDLLQPFSAYREYLHWEWMEHEQGENRYEPSDRGNGFFDSHFKALKDRNIQIVACINESPDWITQGYPPSPHRKEYKPVPLGESPLDPASYRHFSRFLYQFTARYGKVAVADSMLTVNHEPRWNGDPVLNIDKSGLGLVEYVEVWNEPDKTWSGPEARFEPEEYAAMLSACYDGHEGKLGPGYGIKTADPAMKVVMGGLSNFDLPYMERMIQWFKTHRSDQKFAADVTNFHHYCNETSYLNGHLSKAISPEADLLRDKLQTLKSALQEKIPGREFWYSEFGYDTHHSSPQYAKPQGQYSATDVQTIWLMRSYLEAIAAGVDKAFMYNIIDQPHPGGGIFQSSGVAAGENDHFAPKSSWYRLSEFAGRLQGLTFDGEVLLHPKARTYRFKRSDGNYVLVPWLHASTGASMKVRGREGEMILDEWPQFVDMEWADTGAKGK
jgi:hypothetical protein